MIPFLNSSGTDDRGEFRIAAAPGKYYLKAQINSGGSSEPPEIRDDGTTEPVYSTTYYPSAASTAAAVVIDPVTFRTPPLTIVLPV